MAEEMERLSSQAQETGSVEVVPVSTEASVKSQYELEKERLIARFGEAITKQNIVLNLG